jgi:DNA-3-methyladenine glycosylase
VGKSCNRGYPSTGVHRPGRIRPSSQEAVPGGEDRSSIRTRLRFSEPLGRGFYDRPTRTVARALLGQWLVHRVEGELRAARIVEVEAYLANQDEASHAYRGRTARNDSMFQDPGTLYVFRIHQVHCANAVTRRGEAVLFRAGEPIDPGTMNTRGPGRLCRALSITRAEDGLDLTRSSVRILPGSRPTEPVVLGPRVGIRRAAELRLRYALRGNPWVSGPRFPGPTTVARRRPAHLSFAHS